MLLLSYCSDRTVVQMIFVFKENQYFFVQELHGLDMCPFCSANAAVRCEKSISIHVNNRAFRVQGKWGHNPKTSFILAYSEIVQGHLCQTSGFNSPSLRRIQHKPSLISNNKIPSRSRVMLIRKSVLLYGLTAWELFSAETLCLSQSHADWCLLCFGWVWSKQSGLSNGKIWALGGDWFELKHYLCIQYESYWFKASPQVTFKVTSSPQLGEISRRVQLKFILLSLDLYSLYNWVFSLMCIPVHYLVPS